ncbi:MAG: hypothetical protein HGB12_00270 [Bacteroidetes bacterium]|nr:hypothetical protein [Bacteroidota bacterium]
MEKIIIDLLAKYKTVVIAFIIGTTIGSSGFWLNKRDADNYKRTAKQLSDNLVESQKRIGEISNQLRIATLRAGELEASININISGANQLAANIGNAISDINDIGRILEDIQKGN